MRLDKYIAHAGYGTRKEVKKLIRKKQVFVNEILCTSDDMHIQEGIDEVRIDEELIEFESTVYIMLHKPAGVICATQDQQHVTVLDCISLNLPKDTFPVGRLDIDTEGLLLICNDGKLAHDLLTPKRHVDKTYFAQVASPLSKGDISILENGEIILDDSQLHPAKVEVLEDTKIYITIREGKYHQIKRMLQAVQNEVIYLKRISMGPLTLDEQLQPGEWRYLHEEEIQALKDVRS